MVYFFIEKLVFIITVFSVKSLPVQVFLLYFHNILCIIYLASAKPFILKFDNQIELFNTWANGNVLIMVITIAGITSDIKILNNMGNFMIFLIGVFFCINLVIIVWYLVKDCNNTRLMCSNKFNGNRYENINLNSNKILIKKIIRE
jgi:hypothetical protein